MLDSVRLNYDMADHMLQVYTGFISFMNRQQEITICKGHSSSIGGR